LRHDQLGFRRLEANTVDHLKIVVDDCRTP
jgi:hypothetical protein